MSLKQGENPAVLSQAKLPLKFPADQLPYWKSVQRMRGECNILMNPVCILLCDSVAMQVVSTSYTLHTEPSFIRSILLSVKISKILPLLPTDFWTDFNRSVLGFMLVV